MSTKPKFTEDTKINILRIIERDNYDKTALHFSCYRVYNNCVEFFSDEWRESRIKECADVNGYITISDFLTWLSGEKIDNSKNSVTATVNALRLSNSNKDCVYVSEAEGTIHYNGAVIVPHTIYTIKYKDADISEHHNVVSVAAAKMMIDATNKRSEAAKISKKSGVALATVQRVLEAQESLAKSE